MGKSTSVKKSKGSDPLTKVKNGGVTKVAESPKAKSKALAKEVAAKGVNGKEKKSKKPVESESESSESEEEEEEESSDESEDDSEDEKPQKKKAANGSAKKAAAASDSDSDSSEEDSDDSDSSEDEKETKAKANGTAKAPAAKKAESDSDDSDSSDDDEEAAAKTKDASDSDSSDSSDSDEEEEEKAAPKEAEEPVKKRKALDDPVIPSKKARTDESEPSSTLFVGSLAWAVNDDILYQAFSECADLVSARVITDREGGRSRGFGYVDFSNHEAAQAAMDAKNGTELEGRNMNIDFSGGRPAPSDNPRDRASNRAQRHGDNVSPESDTLFVGNLSFDIDQDSVREFFASTGDVTGVRLPTDPESGQLKGFGYVTFSSVEEAKTAFNQLNGQYLGEGRSARAVRLDFAGARPPREGGGGGGGRGGFGGGRGGGRGGFGGRGGGGFGGRGGGGRGGRGGGRGGFSSTNRGGLGDFKGTKVTF